MAYNTELADRVRERLHDRTDLEVIEKKMFGGLAFMVDGKMCINVSQDRLMCRFDPKLQASLSEKIGYEEMIHNGRSYKGYCYIYPEGYDQESKFDFWVDLCLAYNHHAVSSK